MGRAAPYLYRKNPNGIINIKKMSKWLKSIRHWRRFMHYIRVGGVCLLILLLAAALPVNVLAQASETATSSPSASDSAGTDAAKTISQSLLSKSAQEETVSADKLIKSNKGLKSLSSTKKSTATDASASAPATASSQASAATPAASSTAETAATSTQTETNVASSPETTSTAEPTPTATEETTITPDQIENTETTATTTDKTETTEAKSTVENTATTAASTATTAAIGTTTTTENTTAIAGSNENVTPPESEAASAVSANTTSTTTDESENATEEDEEEESEPVDRIWREGISSDDYTWDYKSFSGFFYDMEDDVGTETLTVHLNSGSRTIDSGGLVYRTEPKELDFKYGDWGKYQVIGFMADKYFAGYLKSELVDTDLSLLDDGQLRQVLIDNDDSQTLSSGSSLPMEEGYELQIKQVDIDGEKVYLGLSKDGEEIDSKVVSPEGSIKSSTYEYKVDVSGEDVPIIMVHVDSVFASTENNLVTVDGVFQLSDTYSSVESGDKYGKMKVEAFEESGIDMENEDSFSLRKGSTVNIFGDVGFVVADDDNDQLRFAPIVDRKGVQEVRGTVIDPTKVDEYTWTPYNFEGFYYDIDEDVGTENLTAKITNGKTIDEGDLLYETRSQPVDFEYSSWGKYDVIGFMADKYFAGYNNKTAFADPVSAIADGQLRKVLIDNDDSQTIASGSVLSLQEGYELQIKSVDLNGNKVYLALVRDGEEIDSKVVTPSSDPLDKSSNYLYKVQISSKDVPIVAAHVESVFRSTESDLATVDALFQVSDSPESVEEGEVHGKMKVESLGDDEITMQNDGTISLTRDKTIEIMDNLKFRVADSSKRLTAPIAIKNMGGTTINISAPDAIVNTPVTISVKSDNTALAGVQIQVNGSTVGTTSTTGSISYTPTSTGTFAVVAKKEDFIDGKANLVVRTASEAASQTAYEKANATLSNKLTINAPAEVIKGENFLIGVVQGINQTPVVGAELSLDDESIGETDSQGSLTYSANVTGEHTLKAEKEGADPATMKISIASSLKVVDLKLPEKAYAGSEMKISAIVENTGSKDDARQFDLKANDTVVASKNATVKGGENTTLSYVYTPKDPGLTEFGVDDLTKTIDIEKAQSNTWLVVLVVVLLIAIGAGYYLYTKGELDGLQRRVREMMKGR